MGTDRPAWRSAVGRRNVVSEEAEERVGAGCLPRERKNDWTRRSSSGEGAIRNAANLLFKKSIG